LFEEQTSWWDLLCNINTGKMIISPKVKMPLTVSIGEETMALDSDNELCLNSNNVDELGLGPFFSSEKIQKAEFAHVKHRLDGWKATAGFRLYKKVISKTFIR
jgi:hypothetical protein